MTVPRVLIVALLCAGALAGVGYGLWNETKTPAAAIPAEPLARQIVARGWIEPRSRIHAVSGPMGGGVVDEVHVREGDRVQAGDLLAVLKAHAVEGAAVDVARADLALAEKELAQVSSGAKTSLVGAQDALIALRSAELTRTAQQLQRTNTLLSRGMVTPDARDAHLLEQQRAAEGLRQARAERAALLEVRSVDVAVAHARVAQARARLAMAEATRDQSVVRAPISGTILRVHARPGAAMNAEGLLEMADIDHLIVLAAIEAHDALTISPGTPARITLDTDATPWAGKATRISHHVYRETEPAEDVLRGRDARVVEVEIELDDARPLPALIGTEVVVSLARPAGPP